MARNNSRTLRKDALFWGHWKGEIPCNIINISCGRNVHGHQQWYTLSLTLTNERNLSKMLTVREKVSGRYSKSWLSSHIQRTVLLYDVGVISLPWKKYRELSPSNNGRSSIHDNFLTSEGRLDIISVPLLECTNVKKKSTDEKEKDVEIFFLIFFINLFYFSSFNSRLFVLFLLNLIFQQHELKSSLDSSQFSKHLTASEVKLQ